MNPEKTLKPMVITGSVLLLSGLIFLLTALSMQSNVLWGPAIGCLGSGVPLLIVGLVQNKKVNVIDS